MAARGRYQVERQRHIDAPPAVVLERIVDLRRWRSWSPWEDLDPDQRREYGGPVTGVGSWYVWDGNRKAGKGRMEIIEADDTSVRIDLQFLRPFRSHSNTTFTVAPEGDGSRVLWAMTGEETRMTRIMGLFTSMDSMIGPDFETGLERLAADAEAAG